MLATRDSGEIKKVLHLRISFCDVWSGVDKRRLAFAEFSSTGSLSPLTTDASGQLNVLWHDGDSLSVDGAKVGVLKKSDHVSLSSFLKGKDCR